MLGKRDREAFEASTRRRNVAFQLVLVSFMLLLFLSTNKGRFCADARRDAQLRVRQFSLIYLASLLLCFVSLLTLSRALGQGPPRKKKRKRRKGRRRDWERKYRHFMRRSGEEFFENCRMTKAAFFELVKGCRPFYKRNSSTRGRKPARLEVKLLQTIRVFGQGTTSFRTEGLVADAHKDTVMEWVIEGAFIIGSAFPILKNPARDDTEAWSSRAKGFVALQMDRQQKDLQSTERWRKELAPFWGGLDGVVEVFDGIVTPLTSMPRNYGSDTGDFKHYKKGWAINNLAGVDCNGLFTIVATRFVGRADDQRMFETLPLFQAMEGLTGFDNADAYPDGCFSIGDSGFSLFKWFLVPFSRKAIASASPNDQQMMRLFNFRLTQLRVEVERAFGILKGRWRILKCLPFAPREAQEVVYACMALHNFLQVRIGNDCAERWMEEIRDEERLLEAELLRVGVDRPAIFFGEDRTVFTQTSNGKEARWRRFDDLVNSVNISGTNVDPSVIGEIPNQVAEFPNTGD